MARAFVAVGSNINPAANVRAAMGALALRATIVAISTVYRTKAEGLREQPAFYNCVIEIRTEIPPRELKFQVLRRIESYLGRRRTADKCAPRTIDLDLILYDDLVLNTTGLSLPDPHILERPFLAIPLGQLAPDLILPGTTLRMADLAASLPADKMRPLAAYTARLRTEIEGKLRGR
jgi:2-amino-4-hydroxy-6-hydroxymethyldihydropteridine diphosphokinase